jgi:hypothetical protein
VQQFLFMPPNARLAATFSVLTDGLHPIADDSVRRRNALIIPLWWAVRGDVAQCLRLLDVDDRVADAW